MCDPTRFILLLCHTVNDVLLLFSRCSWLVHRANKIDLVILPGMVSSIDSNDILVGVMIQFEYWIGAIPVDSVDSGGGVCGSGKVEQSEDKQKYS